ncbi:MAG: hypothetical protein ABJO30_03745 [Hyphomicrobiales bacterium]
MIIQPKYLALDTSQWVRIIDNGLSASPNKRKQIKRFKEWLIETGQVPVVTLHHLQEIAAHENGPKARQRINFLSQMEVIAWLKSAKSQDIPGSIVDLQSREVQAALSNPNANALEIVKMAKEEIFAFGSGTSATKWCLDYWPYFWDSAVTNSRKAQETASIARSSYLGIEDTTLSSWASGKVHTIENSEKILTHLENMLALDLATNGDERLPQTKDVSECFFSKIRENVLSADFSENPTQEILKLMGLKLADLDPNLTLGEIGNMVVFNAKLKVICQNLGVNFASVKHLVDEEKLPSQIIQQSVVKFRQKPKRERGSDLVDVYLLALSPYVERTFVDKRTYENCRRAKAKSQKFADVIGAIEKVTHYEDLMAN